MNAHALNDILARSEHWPESAQEELLRVAQRIEKLQAANFELDESDWKIIDARLVAARQGEIATEFEVKTVFDKYRLA